MLYLAPVLDVGALPTLTEVGFSGGRNSFRDFCVRMFAADAPRFLRTDDNALVVFRHADLRAIGAKREIANVPPAVLAQRGASARATEDEKPPREAIVRVLSNQVFFANDPIHGPIRRALLNQMGPKSTDQLEPLARQIVTELLSGLGSATEFDLVADLAEQLTVKFWGALIGLTDAEIAELTPCVRAMTPLLYMQRDLDQSIHLNQAFELYGRIIERGALRSLEAGAHPFVEGLAAELARIRFDDDPERAGIVPANVGLLIAGNLFDGFHTAALAAANTIFALSSRPKTREQIRETPSLLAGAVTEALRLEPPVILLNRYVLDDVVIDDFSIPKGSTVVMMWGAGNQDPKAFPVPGDFDPTRSHQGVTTFGGGLHICPGRFVSVMLTRVLLEVLSETAIELEPLETHGQWIDGHKMCQLRAFPVRVHRRSKN